MRFNLSEITAVIKDRRSIPPELFSNRKVQKEIVEHLLRNATWAPTHGKTQPWRFKVFTDQGLPKLGNALAEVYTSETPEAQFSALKLSKLSKRFETTSVVIAVCMERQVEEKIPEIEEIAAVACAVQNLSLTATAYGLSAFWSSPAMVYSKAFASFLKLNTNDKCLGLIYLGYPAGDWPQGQRKPLEYISEWIAN